MRTIKALTRATLEERLTFEESVQLANETIRQTPHNTLEMTAFQMYFGCNPSTSITNLIGQPTSLLSNWKRTITKYDLAQLAELQVFTIHDSDGKLAYYLVVNESKKRGQSVSENFKQYLFLIKKPTKVQ